MFVIGKKRSWKILLYNTQAINPFSVLLLYATCVFAANLTGAPLICRLVGPLFVWVARPRDPRAGFWNSSFDTFWHKDHTDRKYDDDDDDNRSRKGVANALATRIKHSRKSSSVARNDRLGWTRNVYRRYIDAGKEGRKEVEMEKKDRP